MMKILLLLLLAFNAGFVDASGFLSLQGLFPNHVTGNFVTLGASLALGTSGVLAKILSLPLFCAVIILARIGGGWCDRHAWPGLKIMFALQAALLTAAAALAWRHGAFPNGDAPAALAMGGLLVAAMAIQNAMHRVRLTDLPPSTMMTGTTTQVMVDVADLMSGLSPEKSAAAKARLRTMSASIVCFAGGCGAAALAYAVFKEHCFLLPPALALATLVVEWVRPREESGA